MKPERIKLLGRSWATRGPGYWLRRVALAIFFTAMFALFVFIACAIFSGVTRGGSPVVTAVLGGYMALTVAAGLWYGGLAFLAQSAGKRLNRSATDEAHIARFESVKQKLNNPGGKVAMYLINGPLLILSPGIFIGLMGAVALGSYQKYFSVREFDAVQRLSAGQ